MKEAGKEGNEEKMDKIRRMSQIMDSVVNKLQEISADERMRELHRAREKSRLDMISKMKYAENLAMEKGMERGMKKGKCK